ncbi:hypothetical protein [Holdemanella biformis]|uniref:hypothetical protein n=1 Tax=Holdemanella biformis TaxID=1735 RepID=UPI00265F7684|nr:hypothetical protein [Holdemanella biformis]
MIKIVRSSSTNAEVTDYYLDVIGSIMEACGEKKYDETIELKQCDKKDIIIAPTAVDFIKIYFKGYKNIIYWMQGLDSEESFMRNGSKLRCFVLDLITKFSMKNALAIFYVSEEMKKYEENKFHISTDEKSFIMPCFNVSRTEALQKDESKYKKNIFTYVGSLSKWQCFEETIDFYKQIEKIDSNAELKIFTFAEEEAKKIVASKEIKNCIVTSVSPDKMTEALADVKFGFVLRENDPVNRVATPTKLSSYLSAGVIPIFSKYVKDFYNRTANFEFVVPISDFKPNDKLY